MASRLDTTFAALRQSGRKAFVAYICAGDPTLEETLDHVRTLVACGVDVIELGLPFSDPLADGIVNQMAAGRALAAGADMHGVMRLIRRIREETEVPLVLFTYLNPVYAYGFEKFHVDAAEAGADGVLLLDLPPDEAGLNAELEHGERLQRICLIAPTTPPDRIHTLARAAQGFIYYISREGVTGAQTTLATNIASQVQVIKASGTTVPVCVGFGISTPEQAREVAVSADGVVVGSAIVKIIQTYGGTASAQAELAAFVKPLVEAVKSV
ncbi:MAG: tryptophan synthase subunit alpha [Verrucomicrobiales bacterium]|nr:tryptophan synthase subunit alpha [Verrucomicrobiales bacterium]